MAVRVQIAVARKSGEALTSVALLNGGFDTGRPEILPPPAACLRLFTEIPANSHAIEATLASGTAAVLELAERVAVHVRTRDRHGPVVQCRVCVVDGAEEVLLSDAAIDEIGVRIESYGKGLWRFDGETRIRRSARARHW